MIKEHNMEIQRQFHVVFANMLLTCVSRNGLCQIHPLCKPPPLHPPNDPPKTHPTEGKASAGSLQPRSRAGDILSGRTSKDRKLGHLMSLVDLSWINEVDINPSCSIQFYKSILPRARQSLILLLLPCRVQYHDRDSQHTFLIATGVGVPKSPYWNVLFGLFFPVTLRPFLVKYSAPCRQV